MAKRLDPLTYDDCARLLGGRQSKKIAGNTRLESIGLDDGSYVVSFHGTDILRFYPDGLIRLSSGGYPSATTKGRLRDLSGLDVYQKNYEWFVMGATGESENHKPVPFFDGMLAVRPAARAALARRYGLSETAPLCLIRDRALDEGHEATAERLTRLIDQ